MSDEAGQAQGWASPCPHPEAVGKATRGKRLSIEQHQSREDLEPRERAARDGVVRSQWQIIWLLAGDATSQEVRAVTDHSLPRSRELAKRSTPQGAASGAPPSRPCAAAAGGAAAGGPGAYA
jgi:hypothetical protein